MSKGDGLPRGGNIDPLTQVAGVIGRASGRELRSAPAEDQMLEERGVPAEIASLKLDGPPDPAYAGNPSLAFDDNQGGYAIRRR